MRIAFFSTKPYDRKFFTEANRSAGHEITFLEPRLDRHTVRLAHGHDAVCVFVNDTIDREVLTDLAAHKIGLVALRCAGFNNVDIQAADELRIPVVRVPAYSPHAVAEHTLALLLALNRKVHRAYNRVRDGNFALDGLLGFDLNGLTAGVVGTGKIGRLVARILQGFGCRVLASDPYPDEALAAQGLAYVGLDELFADSDIISLHCHLTPESHHLVNEASLSRMKHGVVLINTSRGALIDSRAVIQGLKKGQIGYLGLDVYEEEEDLFFEDLSGEVIQDDVFARLNSFPNVIITGHQAFFTREALGNIAETTLGSISEVEATGSSPNRINPRRETD